MFYSVSSFDVRFAAYRPFLEAYARRRVGREDAEDVVCVCYLEARQSLACYRPEQDLRGWLLGI